jgi:hypothetical protein
MLGSKISQNAFLIVLMIIQDNTIENLLPEYGCGRMKMKGPLAAATES